MLLVTRRVTIENVKNVKMKIKWETLSFSLPFSNIYEKPSLQMLSSYIFVNFFPPQIINIFMVFVCELWLMGHSCVCLTSNIRLNEQSVFSYFVPLTFVYAENNKKIWLSINRLVILRKQQTKITNTNYIRIC